MLLDSPLFRCRLQTCGVAFAKGTGNAACPSVSVTAPGTNVQAGPGGTSVTAPGTNVQSGPSGTTVTAPGTNVNVRACRASHCWVQQDAMCVPFYAAMQPASPAQFPVVEPQAGHDVVASLCATGVCRALQAAGPPRLHAYACSLSVLVLPCQVVPTYLPACFSAARHLPGHVRACCRLASRLQQRQPEQAQQAGAPSNPLCVIASAAPSTRCASSRIPPARAAFQPHRASMQHGHTCGVTAQCVHSRADA